MDAQPTSQPRVGSIYKTSRRSSMDSEYQLKLINTENIEPSQLSKRRDSMYSTTTLESNKKVRLSEEYKLRGKNSNQSKDIFNPKIQLGNCYKDKENLKTTIISQMKEYSLQEAAIAKKIDMFEANYNKILTNYQRKNKQLKQQLEAIKQIPNPVLQKYHNKYHKQYPSQNDTNHNIANNLNQTQSKFKQFYQAIHKQIQYEKQLRSIKILIHNHQKKQEIYSELALNGIKEESLLIVSQQYDPFEQHKQVAKQSSKIALDYLLKRSICQENWNKSIKDNWKQSDMREFFQKINSSGKSEICLKDFVREINFLTSNNYRLRDIYQIYVRLKPMTADNFVRKLSIKNR